MSPQQGDSGGTIRLQLLDGRQVPFRLRPENHQYYYGGVRRDEASERAEMASLAKLVALGWLQALGTGFASRISPTRSRRGSPRSGNESPRQRREERGHGWPRSSRELSATAGAT